jgi:hypothetical protein
MFGCYRIIRTECAHEASSAPRPGVSPVPFKGKPPMRFPFAVGVRTRDGLVPGSIGGLVTAWYSPAGTHATQAMSRRWLSCNRCTDHAPLFDENPSGDVVLSCPIARGPLADSHLTSPVVIQLWTTSSLVYLQR